MANIEDTYRGIKITIYRKRGKVEIKLDTATETVYMTPDTPVSETLAMQAAKNYIDQQFRLMLN